ncbi:MAG TPA: ATP-binding protein, partial [Chloroflexota bacterium]
CRAGFTVAYVGAHELLVQLRAARGDGSYEKRLIRFTAPDVLIIDDLGSAPRGADSPCGERDPPTTVAAVA